MKKLIRILLLTLMCFFVTSNSAALNVKAAEKNEVSGIEITISSDKDEYNSNEKATFNYSIKNNSENNLNSLNWELTLPEKLSLTSGDLSGKGLKINAGETIDGSAIIMVGTTAASTTTAVATTTTTTVQKTDSAQTGDYVNIALPLSIIAIAAAIAFMTRKKGKKALKFFCFLICATCISAFLPADALAAEYDHVTASVDKTIKIDNSYYTIEFSIDFAPDEYEVSVSNQLYAWADYSKKDNTITIQWLKQEDAISYKVYEKNASKQELAEVIDKTEYVYNINTSDVKDEYVFYVKESKEKGRSISNDVIVKRGKNGKLSFEDIDSDNDGLNDLSEIKLKTDRLDKDTDKDGLIDGYEVSTVKTDPLIVASRDENISDGEDDIDGDGLTNADEYTYSTDPFVGDTDGDGFPDGYEVLNGMDPLKYDQLSLETINVSELDDNGEYDLEILNLTEDYSLDIFYNEDGNVETINGVFTDRQIQCAQDAFCAICNVRSLLGIKDSQNELKFSKLDTNKYFSSYSFDIEYKGIEVYGRDITVTCDLNGKVSSITSYYISSEILDKLNTVPDISEKDISGIINNDSGSKAEIKSCNLYIKPDTETVLAYNVITSDNEMIWINAHSGEIINRFKKPSYMYLTDRAYGEIENRYNDEGKYEYPVSEKPLSENDLRGYTFYMYDMNRQIALYSLKDVHNYSIADIIDNDHGDVFTYGYIKDNTLQNLPSTVAVSTYYNVIQAYDWYNRRGYAGLNGKGSAIPVFIEDKSLELPTDDYVDGNGLFTPMEYADPETSEILEYDSLHFGPHTEGKRSEGSCLEFVGHEYGHSIFKNKSNVVYGEDIAKCNIVNTINEAYADIFGSCVSRNWMQHKKPFRNVTDPKQNGNPAAFNDENYDSDYGNENYDVHKNSTVISHAAYFMTNKYGLDMETIWELFYHSLFKINDNTKIEDIRGIIVQTARNLHYSETVISGIGRAFDEVNIIERKGSVQIQVIDHSQPLKNGLVSIVKSENIIKQLNTDENGVALFQDLDIGTYDVRVKSPDGQVISAKVTVSPYMTTYKTIYFGTGSANFDWVHYDHYNYDQEIGPTLPKHINISDSEIKMIGYTEDQIKDFLITNENDNESSIVHSKQKNISFSLKRDNADWHTMEGGGFLFDVSLSNEDITTENGKMTGSKTGKITAHCLLVTKQGLKLCFLNNVDIAKLSDGGYREMLGLDSTFISNIDEHIGFTTNPQYTNLSKMTYDIGNVLDEHNFTIRIDKSNKEYITVWDNGKVIINNLCINKLDGDDFGPITSHINHWCKQVSYFTFSDIKINLVSVN